MEANVILPNVTNIYKYMFIKATIVREKALAFAAEKLELSVDDLDMGDNTIFSLSNPEINVNLSQIALEAHDKGYQFIGIGSIIPQNAPPYLAQFAEVEVDIETGKIKVIKWWAQMMLEGPLIRLLLRAN